MPSQEAAPSSAPEPQSPNVFDQAVKQYPIIARAGVVGVVTPKENAGYLEFYPPGETGTKEAPRPAAIPIDRPGVEIYSGKTSPLDVLGDVVSHHLVKSDPKIAAYYQQFQKSLTPDQQARLQEQYQWDQQKEGETRPFSEWAATAGLPAYFRGYAFKQWPDDFNAQAYTPDQRAMFDQMMQYLQAPQQQVQPPGVPTTRLQGIN